MKIYILYENPFDEGDNVFGAFSTKRKANKAQKIFSEANNHDVYIREIELDDLEKHFKFIKSGYKWFSGHRMRYEFNHKVIYGDWSMSQCGVESLLEGERKENVMERKTHVWSSILAKSEEEAKEKADEILRNKGEGYIEWLE